MLLAHFQRRVEIMSTNRRSVTVVVSSMQLGGAGLVGFEGYGAVIARYEVWVVLESAVEFDDDFL